MVLVRDIMSRDVLKISESASVAELTSILTRHRITGLPVLDSKGKLVGVVSEFDVIDRRGKTVADIMSREPITLTADAPVGEAARLFVTHRIRRVPVMDGDKLIGIVSRADIITFFATRQWQCAECGFTDRGFEPPETCPSCGAPAEKFKLTQAPPGM
jgi:tRNA nucleotidyltransferase (CCA-adding enzyme)